MTDELLAGRVCLITGSSRGIGLGIARVFAANGAVVTLHGRDEATLNQSLASLRESPKHKYIVADLNTCEGLEMLVERKTFPRFLCGWPGLILILEGRAWKPGTG